MLLHLLPLSCPAPPFHLRGAGGSPRVRAGGRARTRALRGTDVEPETPPRRRHGREDDHDPHAAGSGGDTGALLASVRRLLLSEAPAAEEEQGQFPKRWAIVFLCFSAFLLCNMDRDKRTNRVQV